MMYSEFIEMTGVTEKYITYSEYTDEIEPIYMECSLTKQEFVKVFKDAYSKIVHPVIENYINNKTLVEKVYFKDNGVDAERMLPTLDREARKLAYQYMQLILLGVQEKLHNEEESRGYAIVDYEGTGMLEVQKLDGCNKFETDEQAVMQAIKDGIVLIPVSDLPYNFDRRYLGWVDTPANRNAILKYCSK